MSEAHTETTLDSVKEANRKAFLAGVGAFAKVEDEIQNRLNTLIETAKDEAGKLNEKTTAKRVELNEKFAAKRDELNEKVTAKRDELNEKFAAKRDELNEKVTAKRDELNEKVTAKRDELVEAGKNERGEKADKTNQYVLAGLGAVIAAKDEANKLFVDLVEAGEKRRAA